MDRETKQEVLNETAGLLGLASWKVSRGSTEPRRAYEDVARALGLRIRPGLTKPQLAGEIARAGGQVWDTSCHSDSTPSGGGGTITLIGDQRVREAVRALVKGRITPARSATVKSPVQERLAAVAEESDAAEEATEYGVTEEIAWEPVVATDYQVRDGSFEARLDAARHRNLLNAALRGHFITVRRLKDAIEATGGETRQGRASVDLLARWSDGFTILAEVKTVPSGLVGRVRLGLAQLFEYRFRAALSADTALMLVLDRPMEAAPDWLRSFIEKDRGVNLAWFNQRFHIIGPHSEELLRRIDGAVPGK